MGDASVIPTVLITGFGPFRNHAINSSWVTVQELLKMDIKDFHIIAKEIPVEYESVLKLVPQLWKDYNPTLVVHCGMSEQARCLTIEQIANNKMYNGCDIRGQLPFRMSCCENGPDFLCTGLDIQKVVTDVNSTEPLVKTTLSTDAGKYLCEFIFYTSLNINKNTAFIHIPPLNQPYRANQMAETLLAIIRSMLKQVCHSS